MAILGQNWENGPKRPKNGHKKGHFWVILVFKKNGQMAIFGPKMGKWSKKTQKMPFLKKKKKYGVIFGQNWKIAIFSQKLENGQNRHKNGHLKNK